MKTLLKMIGNTATLLALAGTVSAAEFKFMPLLNGYNVLVQTNSTAWFNPWASNPGSSIGSTNVLNTTYAGQILYSLTNNVVNGTLTTNTVAPDAYKIVTLSPDANGDINANAALYYCFGNTNYIPIVVTNLQGQYFIPNNGTTTNYATAAYATQWPLSSSGPINWMFPGTTNLYPLFGPSATNTVTITLIKGAALSPDGAAPPPLAPLFETTGTFSFTLTFANANVMVAGSTNLPVGWLQGASRVAAYVNLPANMSTNASTAGLLLNQLGILQATP